MTNLERLDLPILPPKEAFFSSLRNEHIREEDYQYCQKNLERVGYENTARLSDLV